MLSRIIIQTAGAVSYTIDADAGNYVLTGSAVTPTANRKNLAEPGNYSLSGGEAELMYSAAQADNATDSSNPREHAYYAHWEALRLAIYEYYDIDPTKH